MFASEFGANEPAGAFPVTVVPAAVTVFVWWRVWVTLVEERGESADLVVTDLLAMLLFPLLDDAGGLDELLPATTSTSIQDV